MGEKVETVGYLVRDRMYDNCFAYFDTWSEAANHADGGENAGANFIGGYAPESLMTVAQHERIVAGLQTAVLAAFPTNWCDPLLTGDKAVIGSPPYGCPDIERLIHAIKQRVSDAFLAQTADELDGHGRMGRES